MTNKGWRKYCASLKGALMTTHFNKSHGNTNFPTSRKTLVPLSWSGTATSGSPAGVPNVSRAEVLGKWVLT